MSKASPTAFESLLAVVLASRPFTWCFAPMLFGIGLVHSRSVSQASLAGKSTSLLTAAVQVFSLSFPLCIIVFGMNDVYDYHSDVVNPRKIMSGLEGSILLPVYHSSVRSAAYLSTVLIFFTSLLTLKAQNVFVTALIIFGGWQYSAPPLRFKEVPLLDSCSNGAGVFLAWLAGYTFGRGKLSNMPDKVFILSLCTAGIHALAAVVDVESDTVAGQTTIATFFGPRFASAFSATTYIIAIATVNGSNIIVNIYLWGGTVIVFVPCLQASLAYLAFRAVVFWSLGMVVVWFGSKAIVSTRISCMRCLLPESVWSRTIG